MDSKRLGHVMNKRPIGILSDMEKTIDFDIGHVFSVVNGTFSACPRANIASGVKGKLKCIHKTVKDLAATCCVTEQTLSNWFKPHGKPGAVDIDSGRLCILIIGLSALNGGEDITSCAGSVAALCDRETLEGGEDAVRERLIASILEAMENKLRCADMEELLALAAVLRDVELGGTKLKNMPPQNYKNRCG